MIHSEPKEYNTLLKNKTLLVVEDEINLREYLDTNLSYTYKVISASNGLEALEIIANEKIDLIISDVMMPKMNGLELCKQVKESNNSIPVILLSAKILKDDKIKGFEVGVDAYLEKPFQLDFLKSRIDNLLKNISKQNTRILNDLSLIDDIDVDDKDNEFFNIIISFLEQNIENTDFNITLLTKELDISKSHLYKKLNEITTVGINGLMLSIRLNKASQLLIHSEKNIVEVATLIGIPNSKYFSTCFKKKFGMTPSKYRKEKKSLNKRVSI